MYSAGDTRHDFFTESGGSFYTLKFEELYGVVHLIRVAEMYLVRAEANFRMNTAVGSAPVDDINLIRVRAHLPAITAGQLNLAKF